MSSVHKKLICGPYVGEFGWEIFSWSGYCRTLSQHFEETIAITRPGRDFLYSDFARVAHFSPPQGTSDCEKHSAVSHGVASSAIISLIGDNHDGVMWFPPFQNVRGAYQHWDEPLFIEMLKGFLKPTYISHDAETHSVKQKILFHARNRPDIRPEDNSKTDDFLPLIAKLKKLNYELYSIGSSNSARIEGTGDLRNLSLSDLAAHMKESIATIGPSSGPLHFASLVGCPIITWHHDSNKNWARYATNWNPLSSAVAFISGLKESEMPPSEMLIRTIHLLEENRALIIKIASTH